MHVQWDLSVTVASFQVLESSGKTAEKSESAAESTVNPLQQQQLQEQQRKQEAVMQKDRVRRISSPSSCDWADLNADAFSVFQGNAYFKEGKYEAAVECYSRGMEADGTNALLPANRAMAYLKLQR